MNNQLKLKDKEAIRQGILASLEDQHQILVKAVATLTDATSHPDAKQEGKYDTRAIEAGYLAGAQSERLQQLETHIQYITKIPLPLLGEDEAVQSGSLVGISFQYPKVDYYFVLERVGGTAIEVMGHKIHVITPESSLGQELIGSYLEDEISYSAGNQEKMGKIVSHF